MHGRWRRLPALTPPRDYRFNEVAKTQLWELPEEERRLLIEYFVRKNLGDVFSVKVSQKESPLSSA